MTVSVFASFYPKPESTTQFLEIMRMMSVNTRNESGCLRYDLFKEGLEGHSYHLFEIYESQEALEAHRLTDHYRQYRADVMELLAQPIGVVVLDPVDE